MKITRFAAAAYCSLLTLAGANCAGNAEMETASATSLVNSGRFIDAPVRGLQYRTATQAGVTDADGTFRFLPGERVTFHIGKTEIGTSTGATIVTPENLSPTGAGLNDRIVKNILRFLQTLDADGVHENGIEIRQTVRDLLAGTSINFDQSSGSFDNDILVKAVVQVSRGTSMTLVDEMTAMNSFLAYRFSGSFTDNYAGKHFLTQTAWQLKDDYTNQTDTIVKINGVSRYLVIQKSASDTFNPSKYQKVVYVANSDGSFYTCTLSPFDSATAAAAEAITDTSDRANPAAGGCSGFSWTKISPVTSPILGNWRDTYSGKHSIGLTTWTVDFGTPATDAVVRYNAIDGYVIIQKPADDGFNPSKFQKIVLTQFSGAWYFCTLSPFNSGSADLAAAIADNTTKTSPGTGGCGGFAWTQLLK